MVISELDRYVLSTDPRHIKMYNDACPVIVFTGVKHACTLVMDVQTSYLHTRTHSTYNYKQFNGHTPNSCSKRGVDLQVGIIVCSD